MKFAIVSVLLLLTIVSHQLFFADQPVEKKQVTAADYASKQTADDAEVRQGE